VAYALGLAAAARGKRAIVCEIASQERGSRLFERPAIGFNETLIDERLWAISIDPERAIREYLEVQLPIRAMSELLVRSRLFGPLAVATPGLQEMVTMGKVWELALARRKIADAPRTYDLVIVDAPATGHGVGFLSTPANFREMARVGPLAHQASRIDETLRDHGATGVAIVATAEEMAVNETLELDAELSREGGFAIDRLFANALYPRRFSREEQERLQRAPADHPAARGALGAALEESRRADLQRLQLGRLRDGSPTPVAELPFIFASRIGAEELRGLAAVIEAGRG